MPDATILSSRLPRVERKAMRPKRLIKPAKVSATVQLTNEISRHRVSASADRYNLLRSDRRLARSKHISEFCRSQFWVALWRRSHCAEPWSARAWLVIARSLTASPAALRSIHRRPRTAYSPAQTRAARAHLRAPCLRFDPNRLPRRQLALTTVPTSTAEHECLFGKYSHSASFRQECESPLY